MVSSGLSLAQEVGHVISATPVMQQVGIPRQVCSTEQVAVQPAKSGAGAVMGAIAGGAVGNAVGGGGGRAAATMLGIFGGAVLGDRIEGAPTAEIQNVQRCAMQTFFENRPVAYNVVLMPPADTGYYARPYYPPVGVELDFGYRSGYGGYGGHRHWR